MKYYRLLIVIGISFLLREVKAQVFHVGDVSACSSMVVNHTFTTTTPSPTGPGGTSSTDSYSFAVTGFPASSISVQSKYFFNGIVSGPQFLYTILFIGNGVQFAANPSTCYSNYIAANLSNGTALTPALNWTSANCYALLASNGAPIVQYTCGVQTSPFYVGFRKVLTNDTIYGWIAIDSNWPGQMISYAFARSNPPAGMPVFTNASSACSGQTLALTASPDGGMFSGPQVSGNVFAPTTSSVYPVYYTTNCSNVAALNITVNPSPNLAFTNPGTYVCIGDSITLTAIPSGGVFSGTYVTGNTLKPTSTGNLYPTYSYTNSYGCPGSVQRMFIVQACTGINELADPKNNLSIFPNPSTGDFEIKSSKEETVMISNELGQALQMLQLNSVNDFSVKVNGLAGGVYFVGNNSRRQKIVVINR